MDQEEMEIMKGLQRWLPDSNIIYYHCGGTESTASQIARYRYKKLL
jgi:hypothetical protein